MCAAINQISASFAATAAALFGNNPPTPGGGNTSSGGGAPNIGIQSVGGNFLLLNFNSNSLSNSMQSNPSSIASSSASSIINSHIEKAEWLNRIENSTIDRSLMNKLIMNYLNNEGFKEAADKFELETGITNTCTSETVNDRIKIREAVESGRIKEAIGILNNLYPEIIDNNRLLAFHLQQQEFIEFIREKRVEEALSYAQNHLCEYGENNEQIKEELERSMALLAFDEPIDSPFSDLLELIQRQRLSCEINQAILEYENLESISKLNVLIKMLLWSQDLLDKRSIFYPKMTDIGNARIEEVNSLNN